MPSPPGSRRRSGLRSVLVVAVAIAVLVSLLLLLVLSWDDSPESAFEDLVKAMNEGDAESAVDCTVFRFAPETERQEAVVAFGEMISAYGDYHVSIDLMEVISEDSLDDSDVTLIASQIEFLDDEWGVKVTDYCILAFVVTMTYDEVDRESHGEITCFEIEGSWYLVWDI